MAKWAGDTNLLLPDPENPTKSIPLLKGGEVPSSYLTPGWLGPNSDHLMALTEKERNMIAVWKKENPRISFRHNAKDGILPAEIMDRRGQVEQQNAVEQLEMHGKRQRNG